MSKRTWIAASAVVFAGTVLHAAEKWVGFGQPYATIQAGIDAANNGDSVRVFPGTYVENISFNGKNIHVFSNSGDFTDTIIDGGNVETVVSMSYASGTLEGFTIQNGHPPLAGVGGGLQMFFSGNEAPLVRNCLIVNNRATQAGAAIISKGKPRFENCRFSANTSDFSPIGTCGGVYLFESAAEFVNCRFDANLTSGLGGAASVIADHASGDGPLFEDCLIELNEASLGGGVYVSGSNAARFVRCQILDNWARHAPALGGPNQGGGILAVQAFPRLESCLVARNQAGTTSREGRGGGLYQSLLGSPLRELVIENCTFADNTAMVGTGTGSFGGGIAADTTRTDVRNSILWGNVATNGGQIAVLNPGSTANVRVAAQFCDLQGGTGAVFVQVAGNFAAANVINSNPLFVGGGDYHLTSGSPAIDAGDPSTSPAIGVTDLDGDPRRLGTQVDLGSDEFVDCAVVTSYGTLTANSVGSGAQIRLLGSTSHSANDAVLNVTGGPPGKTGLFLYGFAAQQVPFDSGFLLIKQPIQRLDGIEVFDASGNVSRALDWTVAPFTGPAAVGPGTRVHFQFWYRDNVGGVNTTNLTDAILFRLCP